MVGIYLWKKVPFCHKSHLYCGAHCLKGNQHGSWDDLNFRWALGSWWGGNVNLFWSLPVLLLWYWIFIFGNYNVACPISACTILWQPYWTWSVLVLKSSDFVENLSFSFACCQAYVYDQPKFPTSWSCQSSSLLGVIFSRQGEGDQL